MHHFIINKFIISLPMIHHYVINKCHKLISVLYSQNMCLNLSTHKPSVSAHSDVVLYCSLSFSFEFASDCQILKRMSFHVMYTVLWDLHFFHLLYFRLLCDILQVLWKFFFLWSERVNLHFNLLFRLLVYCSISDRLTVILPVYNLLNTVLLPSSYWLSKFEFPIPDLI